MEQKEISAYHAQDFELLKSLSTDLTIVRSVSLRFVEDNYVDWFLTTRFTKLVVACSMEGRLLRSYPFKILN